MFLVHLGRLCYSATQLWEEEREHHGISGFHLRAQRRGNQPNLITVLTRKVTASPMPSCQLTYSTVWSANGRNFLWSIIFRIIFPKRVTSLEYFFILFQQPTDFRVEFKAKLTGRQAGYPPRMETEKGNWSITGINWLHVNWVTSSLVSTCLRWGLLWKSHKLAVSWVQKSIRHDVFLPQISNFL